MIYQRLFQEKALSLSDAKDCCLYINSISGYIRFILYDPTILKKKLFGEKKLPSSDIKKIFETEFYKSILSTITIANEKKAEGGKIPSMVGYTIQGSAAKPDSGAGVLLYDIVLSYLTKKGKGLVPDRQSVSTLAQKVWKYYFTKRNDVKHIPIDDYLNQETEDKNDDGSLYASDNVDEEDKGYDNRSFINHMYFMKKPLDYKLLIKNHNSFFKDLTINLKQNDVEWMKDKIYQISYKFFINQYKKRAN